MWHWEEDNARYYRSSLTGVYLLDYNGNSYSISDIIKSGNVSHTNIEISPNGKYLSYSIEDGASFGVYDLKENKELFKMPETEGVRYGKVVWLDDENFVIANKKRQMRAVIVAAVEAYSIERVYLNFPFRRKGRE
jgi:WD40 repeat protein